MSPADGRAARRNRIYAVGGAALAVGMISLTFAAAPFYSAFCRATGYEGAPQRVEAAASTEGKRTLRVAFDTNVAPGLNWRFEPETELIKIRAGKTATVYFRAENLSDKEVGANATFNVTPEVSGGYFDKIKCFCFTEQHLGPHETAEWPVVFFLDPTLESDPSMAKVDFDHAVVHAFRRAGGPQLRRLRQARRPGRVRQGGTHD